MNFRQLWPQPGDVEIEAHVAGLGLADRSPAERPYTVVNFVSSLDGRATYRGRSGGLGDDGDRVLFRTLRGAVDAVLVGTGTLRNERFGRLLRDPAARQRRVREGRAPEPLACLVSRSGLLPLDIPLFAEPEAEIVVFAPEAVDLSGVQAQVELVRLDPEKLTFTAALRHLRVQRGVRALLCEGGPTVFGALLGEGLVDELFLTLAPKLTGGGTGPAVTAGPELAALIELALAGVLEREGSLFLRYRRATPAA